MINDKLNDNRNVIDRYKGIEINDIREDLKQYQLPYAVAVQNITGDFNLGTVVRNGNAFGTKEIFYVGGKKGWDKRADVGARHYSAVTYLKTFEELSELKKSYIFVGLENNIENTVPLSTFQWPVNSLMIFGEEGAGLTPEVVAMCDFLVEIEQRGSVRSINLGSASAIAMWDYLSKICRDRQS